MLHYKSSRISQIIFISIHAAFLLLSKSCLAQNTQPIFEHLTTKHGLSSDNVESIAQDEQGFYWIATLNGFNRFDGTHFKVFRNKEGDSTSLSHNSCRVVKVDRKGNIWIGTFRGVSKFQKSTGNFKQLYFKYPGQAIEQSYNVFDIMPDKEDHVWVAGYGLWKYDADKDIVTTYVYDSVSNPLFPRFTLVTNIEMDTVHHGLWFSTDAGLIFYDEEKKIFYHEKHNPLAWKIFENSQSRKISIDHYGRIWFRYHESDALCYFDLEDNTITLTTKTIPRHQGARKSQFDDQGRLWILYYLTATEIYDPSDEQNNHAWFIGDKTVTSLFIDRNGNYWISSPEGIYIYKKENQYYNVHRLDIKNERGPENEPFFIRAFAQHESGNIWLSTNLGFYEYDLHNRSYHKEQIESYQPVSKTICFTKDLLWFNVDDQLWTYDVNTHSVIRKYIYTSGPTFLQQGTDQNIWMGLRTSGLYNIDHKSGSVLRHYKYEPGNSHSLSTDYVSSFLQVGERIWVGYNHGKGFSTLSLGDQQWKHFQPQTNVDINASAIVIDAITKDDNGHLWLGTLGNGVFVFNPVDASFLRYTQEHGLSSNFINSILKDDFGNMWISTADGINYLPKGQNTIVALDIDIRFKSNYFTNNAFSGKDGKLYFFSNEQFVEIDPRLYRSMTEFPDVVISDFYIFDNEVSRADHTAAINLTYKENFFSFTYSAIKTHPDKKVRYAYQLDGFDKNWIYPIDLNRASYTNVPAGKYLFQIKATNEQGDWSDVLVRIPIHISPPFWRTWWFVSLMVLGLASVLYLMHNYRINQLKKLARLRSKISRDLHDEVGSSLSSIHVYSGIAAKSFEKSNEITKQAIEQIHQNSRQVLDNMNDIVWAINHAENGSSSLQDKLKNFGYEFLTPLNINVTYNIDPEADRKINNIEARKNILLIAKEAMNNIAKYSQATEAKIEVELSSSDLEMKISDNGKGFSQHEINTGNGLHNMKFRSERIGGKFNVNSTKEKGTVISCRFPITNISSL